MAKILLYTRPNCSYCTKAKALLTQKNLSFEEIDASGDKREEMIERANGRNTFPQIFINDSHIGGYDDLYTLNESGKIDALV